MQKNLYLRGIRDGKLNEVKNYIGDQYIQHSTGVKDGEEGFVAFFEEFLKRNKKREINIIREIEDENFMFVHVYQKLNDGESEWITTDMFRSDKNGQIIEHWDVIDIYPKNVGDINPVLGDFQLSDLDKTEENKKQIRCFLTDILQNREFDKFDSYVATNLIQHNLDIGQGGIAYKNYLLENEVKYDFIFKIIGQGNYVVAYSKVYIKDNDYAYFDIYRLQDGKIIEHWDNKESIPDVKSLVNLGKF